MRFDIGTFDTETEAAMAYDWAARILYGPKAMTNFPDKIVPALAAYLIRTSEGYLFDVGFRKRSSGEFRFMTCRVVTPPGPYYMAKHGLITVVEKGMLGYRCIPVDGLETLYINNKKYTVVP